MSLKIQLSARPGMAAAQEVAAQPGVYRKDYIIAGKWSVKTPDGSGVFDVDADRMRRWDKTHELLMARGVTVPLTVDHMEVRDPATGLPKFKRMTPAMAEAKRGTVLGLETQGNRGFCSIKPADQEAVQLLGRCPEVSLELTQDFVDGKGNYYDEAITAITLTPKPIVQGQQQEWVPVNYNQVHASQGFQRATVYLSAEPVLEDPGTTPPTRPELENDMTPAQIAEARRILKLGAEVPDAEIAGKVIGACQSFSDRVSSLETAKTTDADRIVQLSREVETAKTALTSAGAKVIRLSITDIAKEIDPDGLDMMGQAVRARINALAAKGYTPAQRTLLSNWLVGTPQTRNVIALSRKAAEQVGLSEPLANKVLEIFEAGNPAEMLTLLTEQSKGQKGTRLSHILPDPSTAPAEDPKLQQQMIDNINGGAGNKATETTL